MIGLFVLKIAAGITAYYIYIFYYPHSDAYVFMEGGKNVFDHFLGNPSPKVLGWNSSFDDTFFNGTRIIIYINFIIQFLSFNNPFVHILFFCFFSFVGIIGLYRAFDKHFPDKRNVLVVGLFLLPSVLFWTSGIYKEGVAILCVGIVIYLTDFGLEKSFSIKRISVVLLLLLLLFFLKIYILIALLPLLLINYLIAVVGNAKYVLKVVFLLLSLMTVTHLFSKLSVRTNVYQLIADKQAKAVSESEGGIFLEDADYFIRLNYNDSAALISGGQDLYFVKEGTSYVSWKQNNMKDTTFLIEHHGTGPALYRLVYKIKPANSRIKLNRMEPTFMGVLKNIPLAIANSFLQPGLFSIKNFLQLFSWIENMWLLLLIALVILFFNKKILEKKEVVLFCVLFALFQFAIIGLTTPVVGAMVRYKVTAIPFLFTICLLCIDGSKLSKKIRGIKN